MENNLIPLTECCKYPFIAVKGFTNLKQKNPKFIFCYCKKCKLKYDLLLKTIEPKEFYC